MIRKSTISILLLSAVAFVAGLGGSLAARSGGRDSGGQDTDPGTRCPGPHGPLASYLDLGPERRARIESLDPTFADDLAALREARFENRRELVALLESAEAADDEIRACVERGIEVHARFERRVLEHLLIVRPQLTPEEQKRLFRSLSNRIRGHGQRFGRHRGPGGEDGGKGWRGDRGGSRWGGRQGWRSDGACGTGKQGGHGRDTEDPPPPDVGAETGAGPD